MQDNLNLYSKIEPYLGISESYSKLHEDYVSLIKNTKPHSLLDIGCGRGNFLKLIKKGCETQIYGIDLSDAMVKEAKKVTPNVENKSICEVEGKFDVITAIGDVLNYIAPKNLKSFFECVEQRLNQGGYFIFDINTLFGFEYVTSGDFVYEDENQTITIKSVFEQKELHSSLSLYTKDGNFYTKESEIIKQYFHEIKSLLKKTKLKKVDVIDYYLFSDESDKSIIILQL